MYMVRGTELGDFLRCRLTWKYRWIDGLQPKKPNNKLFFGTMMHKWIENFYQTKGAARTGIIETLKQELNDSQMDELEAQDAWELFTNVHRNYYNEYISDFDNWEVIATELTFAIPLDDEIGYTGTIDLIVRDKSDGRIYFLDHKTTNSIEKYDKNSDMDRQISRYWWALQQLQQGNGQVYEKVWNEEKSEIYYDWMPISISSFDLSGEIGVFLYNIILKDYPVPPKILKNGSLSKDKSQRTTARMYMDALIKHGIAKPTGEDAWHEVPHEYAEMVTWLRDNPKEFFRRIRVTRTQSEIDASIEELYATALDMKQVQLSEQVKWGTSRIYRNITKDCPWCPFQPICQASMDGSNVEYLMEALYEKQVQG